MDYLEGNPTGVTAAYYAFLDSMANEVRDVPQGNAWECHRSSSHFFLNFFAIIHYC